MFSYHVVLSIGAKIAIFSLNNSFSCRFQRFVIPKTLVLVLRLQDDVAVVLGVPLLDVIEESELLEGFLPESEDVVLGLAGGGCQQVGDGLEDGVDGLGRDAFFA